MHPRGPFGGPDSVRLFEPPLAKSVPRAVDAVYDMTMAGRSKACKTKNYPFRGAAPADGVNETSEDRAKHIAESIGRCAKSMGIPPSDLTWWDYREFASVQWGQNTVGVVRRDITRLGGFESIRDAYFPREDTDQAVTKGRIREHAALSRRLGRHLADEAFQYKQMEAFAERVFKGRIKPVPYRQAKKGRSKIKRELVILLGDLHIGADLVGAATGGIDFGPLEEARFAAQVVRQVCTYKEEYRDETSLRVVMLGDLIHGCLHDPRDGAIMAEQKDRAIHLLSQVVAQLSSAFPKVAVEMISGNHDRDKLRHPKRATSSKWDSNATAIYCAVRRCCLALRNVEFHMPLAACGHFEVFGKRYFYTHGDTVISVGNPGCQIKVTELENQVNKLNATLKDKDEYAVVLVGHAHQFLHIALNNGVTIIVNGPFTAQDEYARSIGIFESIPSQTMFEVTPGYPVGDLRRIILDKKVAKDSSLDEIVRPWRALGE